MSVSYAGIFKKNKTNNKKDKTKQKTFLSSLGLMERQVVHQELPEATRASTGQPAPRQNPKEHASSHIV